MGKSSLQQNEGSTDVWVEHCVEFFRWRLLDTFVENGVTRVVDYDVNLTVRKILQSLPDDILPESQFACITLQGNSFNAKILDFCEALESGGFVRMVMQDDLNTR